MFELLIIVLVVGLLAAAWFWDSGGPALMAGLLLLPLGLMIFGWWMLIPLALILFALAIFVSRAFWAVAALVLLLIAVVWILDGFGGDKAKVVDDPPIESTITPAPQGEPEEPEPFDDCPPKVAEKVCGKNP